MNKQVYQVQNKLGLHVRPAKHIVEAAKSFGGCMVKLEKDGKTVDAKSLVAVLSLGAKFGDELTLLTEGEQAEEVQRVIGAILSSPLETSPGLKKG